MGGIEYQGLGWTGLIPGCGGPELGKPDLRAGLAVVTTGGDIRCLHALF